MKIDYDRKTGFVFKSPTVKDSKLYRCEGSWNNGIENNTQETTFHLTISREFLCLKNCTFLVVGSIISLRRIFRIYIFFSRIFEFNMEISNVLFSISARELSAQPHIQLPGAAFPVEGNSLTLNCSVQVKMGSIVFIAWKCPFGDCANVSVSLFFLRYLHNWAIH